MELRPGYKRTTVGIIPDDWEASTVGQQFSVQLGKMLDAKMNVGVVKPYLGNRAVQWNRIDIGDPPSVKLSPSDLTRFRLEKDDLLVCEGGEVGRAAIWEAPIDECYYQKALHRLRPLKGYDPRFMLAILRRWADKGMLTNYVTQTSIAHLPRDRFIEVPIPLPSMAEQSTIAVALSDVDALLNCLDRLIAKKQNLKQAAMQQLLTGRTRLPGFRREWERKRVGEVGTTYGGLTGKTKADFGIGNARYITFLNVLENVVIHHHQCEPVRVQPEERQNLVRKADILFNGTSETPDDLAIAAVAHVCEDNTYLNSFCFGFRLHDPSENLPLFIAYYFRGPPGRRIMHALAQGATRYNLSKKQFLALSLSLPVYDEQEAIATVLSDIDAEITALEVRRDKTQDLKQAMMQELLTGKTRLVKPGTAHA